MGTSNGKKWEWEHEFLPSDSGPGSDKQVTTSERSETFGKGFREETVDSIHYVVQVICCYSFSVLPIPAWKYPSLLTAMKSRGENLLFPVGDSFGACKSVRRDVWDDAYRPSPQPVLLMESVRLAFVIFSKACSRVQVSGTVRKVSIECRGRLHRLWLF